MTLQSLLDGPSYVTTTFGQRHEIIRLASRRVEPEFRKVNISYALVTTQRRFLFPWKVDRVMECWDIAATLRLKDGRVFSKKQLVSLNFDRAVELMMLEVVKQATLDKSKKYQARLAS